MRTTTTANVLPSVRLCFEPGFSRAALVSPRSAESRYRRRTRVSASASSDAGTYYEPEFDKAMSALRKRIQELRRKEDEQMTLLWNRIKHVQCKEVEDVAANGRAEWMDWELNCHPAVQLQVSEMVGKLHRQLVTMRPSTILLLVSGFYSVSSVVVITALMRVLHGL